MYLILANIVLKEPSLHLTLELQVLRQGETANERM
jgi:hypothetical protein